MTTPETKRLDQHAANFKALEERILTLEEQVGVCLEFIRKQAEALAKKVDPDFKPRTRIES